MALIPAMLAGTTFDCSEPGALAAFYLDLFGWKRVWESEDSVLISADGRMVNCLGFQRVHADADAAVPAASDPDRLHRQARLEFLVEGLSLDEAQAAAVDGGARLPEAEQPNPNRLRVLVDPAGHTFSLCAME
ncbi:MAG TPA: VOC family protein [Actinocrinis sp.]|nr:VOC family protein [Actinocrinis sp.]